MDVQKNEFVDDGWLLIRRKHFMTRYQRTLRDNVLKRIKKLFPPLVIVNTLQQVEPHMAQEKVASRSHYLGCRHQRMWWSSAFGVQNETYKADKAHNYPD